MKCIEVLGFQKATKSIEFFWLKFFRYLFKKLLLFGFGNVDLST